MLILGIDPGMAETGWGIIKESAKGSNGLKLVDYGCIKTDLNQVTPERLLSLKRQLKQIILQHRPDFLAIEQLFFGRNSKTAMLVNLARGVMMVTAAEQKVPVFEYQGLSVKLNLSGNGHASKSKIQSVVRRILRLKFLPRPQHAADALACAICHVLKTKS